MRDKPPRQLEAVVRNVPEKYFLLSVLLRTVRKRIVFFHTFPRLFVSNRIAARSLGNQ